MRRRLIGPLGVATALTASFGLFAGAALASPTVPSDEDIASVDAQADDAASQIAALEAELASNQAAYQAATIESQIAAEAYNVAAEALEDAEAEQTAARQAQAQAEADLDEASAVLADLAMASYRSGGELAQLGSLLSAEGFEEAIAEATTYQVLGAGSAAAEQRYADAEIAAAAANERAAAAVIERTEAADEMEAAAAAAQAAADEAASILAANESRREELVAQLAALRQTSVEMERERQAAAEAERIAAENEAAAAERGVDEDADQAGSGDRETSNDSSSSAPPPERTTEPTADPTTTTPTSAPTTSKPTTTKPPHQDPPPPPPSSNANLAALEWAKTQIGKPYVWGAQGPDAYDCSGLTMQAYAHAGISIARTSGAQYYSGDRVPVGQMQPGDLFFYSSNGAPSGIYHVAIYAGNGMRVHAPSPGKPVELTSMWWPNVLDYAVRP